MVGSHMVDDLLMEVEDITARRKRTFKIAALFALSLIMLLSSYMIYDLAKPLPNTEKCESLGYEAGIIKDGKNICYDDCPNKKIIDCRRMWMI